MDKSLETITLHDDQFKPLPPNKSHYRLYGHPNCAYTERVRLTLALKQIPYQFVSIDFPSRPDWFKKLGSDGKVPLLEFKNQTNYLYESSPLIYYLEESTASYLLPGDLMEKTKIRMLVSQIDGMPSEFYTTLKSFGKNKESIKNLKTHFAKFEAKLGDNKKGKFFLDYDHPTLADIVLLPHFRRAVLFEGTECDEAFKDLKFSEYPRLMKWMEEMLKFGEISKHVVDKETWSKFLKYFKDTTKFEFRMP